MNICVDIDGTMTTCDYYIPFLNKFFNKNVIFQNVLEYDLRKIYEVTDEQLHEFYEEKGNEMHASAIIQPHVKETIIKWLPKHHVDIVTARLKEKEYITVEWMKKHGLSEVPLHSLGSSKKLEISKELNCDVFIEDHPEESIRLAENGIFVLLMDNPYNKHLQHENMKRVFNWYEIEHIIEDWHR